MGALRDFDQSLLLWINACAGRWPAADDAIRVFADWNFARSAWLGCFIVWAWFAFKDQNHRLKIISGLAGLFVATGLSRVIQATVYVHARPFTLIDELKLNEPHNLDTHWGAASSFPSDTATLYFALAMIIASLSRPWGFAAFAWVLGVIALPRIFILYHWPSDVIAGLALGVGCVLIAQRNRFGVRQFGAVVLFEKLEPQFFYPLLFIALYQIVDSFSAIEVVIHEISALSRHFPAVTAVTRQAATVAMP